MKKFLSALLICVMMVSVLTACGNQPEPQTDNQTNSTNETESKTEKNSETTAPKEAAFLPPAEHSNFIAPKAEKGKKYNIKKLDFINNKTVGSIDGNRIVVGEREVYDLDGNLLFDEQKIIGDYPGELSSAGIPLDHDYRASAFGDFVILYDGLLYNYVDSTFFNFYDEDIEPLKIYDGYIVVHKYDSEEHKTYYSVIDFDNQTIIPFDAGYYIDYIGNDCIIASKDGKYFILDMSGNVVSELKNKYREITFFHGLHLNYNEQFMFLNLNNQITDYMIGKIGNKENESDQFISSYSYYLIDKKGNEIHLTDADASFDSCRLISQYNQKSYLIEYLNDYFYDNETGWKIQKRQLIDENRNVIIKPCFELSGYINGYCRVGEYDENTGTVTYSLIDLDGNAIESFSYTINNVQIGKATDFSNVDEKGLYTITEYENNTAVYSIKDTAGNVVFKSDSEIEKITMLGNGVFRINHYDDSKYESLIIVTPA